MRQHGSLTARLGLIGSSLLLMALLCAGASLWASWQIESSTAALVEAGHLRAQTWQMAHGLAAGDTAGNKALARQFDSSLALLANGDPSRPLLAPTRTTHDALARITRHWQTLRPDWNAIPEPNAYSAQAQAQAQAVAMTQRINAFTTSIQREQARWTTLLNGLQMAMAALAIGSAIALVSAMYPIFFEPLRKLQHGLARIAAGDLSARIEAHPTGELGALSALFNRMAERLRLQHQGLDAKVEEKTLHLDAERARLAALHASAAIVAKTSTIGELAQAFARQTRQVARADASAVRWCDERQSRYLLLASDGLPQAMAEEEHCIATGRCHCAPPSAEAATRIFPIHQEAHRMLGHCERAGYRTVLSVPLMLHERTLGQIGLFYYGEAALSAEDRALLETLASHLASAIESLRTLALEREAAIAAERTLLARELHDSIAQGLAFLKLELGLLRDARARGDAVRMEHALCELETGVHESLLDVRELLVNFRTRAAPDEIEPALRTIARKFEHQTGLAAHLSIDGEGLPLAPDVQVQVLHVVQEALSNVRKHAKARQVWIDVAQRPAWRVTVRDDGRGFDTEPLPDSTHVGLNIMRERAQRIGATVDIASMPGTGTRIALTLPGRMH